MRLRSTTWEAHFKINIGLVSSARAENSKIYSNALAWNKYSIPHAAIIKLHKYNLTTLKESFVVKSRPSPS